MELRAVYRAGKAVWPRISLSYDAFRRRAESLPVTRADLAARAGDLVLAFACAEQDATALRAFNTAYISQVPNYVARFNLAPDLVAEIGQRVRMKQLLGHPPGIARYRGRGPLGAWVRVSAVRVAVDVVSAGRPAGESDDQGIDLVASLADSPEVETLKNTYRERFAAAIEESLATLKARDRTLLRLQVVDGLGVSAIAGIYRVHRATAARWLAAVRARVLRQLRQRLTPHTAASTRELRSIVRLLRNEMRVNVTEVLSPDGGSPPRLYRS